MGKRLVTIVTFDQAAQAELARNVLDDAGIRAVVSDATIVAMDWLLSNAVGGAKVQVWEEDAEHAVAVLQEKLGEDASFGPPVSPEELAAAAEAAAPEEGEEPEPERRPLPTPGTSVEVSASEEAISPPSERDDYARRGVFTAILGVIVTPSFIVFLPMAILALAVVFYAVYLHLNAGWGAGPLSSRGRFNLFVGVGMTLANLGLMFLYLQFWVM